MLSVKQMKDAIFARSCDADPDAPGEAAARYLVALGYPNSVEEYRRGKEILERFTLRFDHRSTVHTMSNNRYPGQDDGVATLRQEAGYIAGAQAYDTAIFNPR